MASSSVLESRHGTEQWQGPLRTGGHRMKTDAHRFSIVTTCFGSRRAALLLTSALGCFATAVVPQQAVHAAPIQVVSAEDVVINAAEASASDTDVAAVEGHSTSGNVSITIGTAAHTGEESQVISGTADAGQVTIVAGQVTGGADTTGIVVAAATGASVTSTQITASGDDAEGMRIVSATGPITVDSGTMVAQDNGIQVLGAGPISISSDDLTTTGEDDAHGILVGTAGGSADVTIASGSIRTAGEEAHGIFVPIDYDFTDEESTGPGGIGRLSITSDSIAVTGRGSGGIVVQHLGDIVIDTQSISYGADGDGIIATAFFEPDEDDAAITYGPGSVTITSGTITGQGGDGISAGAGGGAVSITSQSITLNDTTGDGDNTAGIDAQTLSGTITIASGFVSVTSSTVPEVDEDEEGGDLGAIRAMSKSGDISITSGTIVSHAPSRSGIYVATGGTAEISSTSITTSAAGAHGIKSVGSGPVFIESGAIATSADDAYAILVEGGAAATLDITGALSSAHATGYTVKLGAGDDIIRQHSGGTVQGIVDGGAGVDIARLDGDLDTASAAQTLALYDNVEQLSVDRGHWTTGDHQSFFEQVTIGAGATLELREIALDGAPESPIITNSVINNGLLVAHVTSHETGSSIGDLQMTGSGSVTLTGTGTVTVDTAGLAHTGTTTVTGGTLVLTGTLVSDVVTSGDGVFVLGDGGTSGSFQANLTNNGRFVFNRSDDYSFTGAFSGTGDFLKQGDGTLTFAGDYSYTGVTRIDGGAVKIAGTIAPSTQIDLGSGSFDVSGTPQTIASLAGGSGSSVIVDNSTLTVDQGGDTSFAGSIEGAGGLVKTGDGRLNLTGTSSYTGPTKVQGGTLAVNGAIVSSVTVSGGGTIGGNGTIGGLTAAALGRVAPGNSIGRLNVAGPVNFAAGSVYEVETNAAGEADRIDATGAATIDSGARVQVLAEDGAYATQTDYVILTAAGGVTGTFDEDIDTNLAFLTPSLSYGANNVTLTLRRNDIDFAARATSPNQMRTANALEALGAGDALFNHIVVLSEAGAVTAFDALSGELHASLPSTLVNESRHVRDAVLGNARRARSSEGWGIWGEALGSWTEADGRPGVAALKADHKGVIAGVDFGREAFRFGLAAGVTDSEVRVRARASRGDVETKLVAANVGYVADRLSANLGASHAWHQIDTARSVTFPGFTASPTADYDGATTQLFGEVSYVLATGPLSVAPFAALAHVRTRTDGFAESAGGLAALTVARDVRKAQFLALGIHAGGSTQLSETARLLPRLSVAWQHIWGDAVGRSAAEFASSPAAFTVEGSRLERNALQLDAGVDVAVGGFRIGAAYVGSVSGDWSDHGAKLSLGWRF